MVAKVTLVEGFAAYVNPQQGWAVMPQWERGAQIMGKCLLVLPGGFKIALDGNPRDVAVMLDTSSGIGLPMGMA